MKASPYSITSSARAKGFRRLKAYKHLPDLRAVLAAHQSKHVIQRVEDNADAA
jgi:hypothetical protein